MILLDKKYKNWKADNINNYFIKKRFVDRKKETVNKQICSKYINNNNNDIIDSKIH